MKRWDVYRYDAAERTATLLGQVKGEHQPHAIKEAARRWPHDAKASFPDYPSGRLFVRPEGDTRGIPARIVK